MEPIDTFKREWPEVVKARSSVLSLVGASVVVTFAFASLLYSTTLSGKDSTIESLNTRIGNLESEKVDLEKKLAAIPAKQVDEEKQRRHQELTEKLPGLIGEGRKIGQTFVERNDKDLITVQYQDWEKKALGLLSELGPAYMEPFQSARGGAGMLLNHNIEGDAVYALLGSKLDVLNAFLGELRR
jgi:hypothetical protein